MEIPSHLYSQAWLDGREVGNRRKMGANWTSHCVACPEQFQNDVAPGSGSGGVGCGGGLGTRGVSLRLGSSIGVHETRSGTS